VADLLRIFESKPDHPLADADEAERLIASLPDKDPRAALEDIQTWLGSLAEFEGPSSWRRAPTTCAPGSSG